MNTKRLAPILTALLATIVSGVLTTLLAQSPTHVLYPGEVIQVACQLQTPASTARPTPAPLPLDQDLWTNTDATGLYAYTIHHVLILANTTHTSRYLALNGSYYYLELDGSWSPLPINGIALAPGQGAILTKDPIEW